jgi:uncharacterized protein with NAD-binding domain and iron-sulfur cluster
MKNNQRKIIIVGAGISGLTVAHYLLKHNFQVTIIEKDDEIGGMAKSSRDNLNVPNEYSWRGYGPFYKNTFSLMKDIPTSNNHTVYDNLSDPINFYLLSDEEDDYKQLLSPFDTLIMSYYGIKYLASNNRRNEYYKMNFHDMVGNKLTKHGYNDVFEFGLGPGLGLEKKSASYAHFYKVPTINLINDKSYEHKHQHDRQHGNYKHKASGSWHVMKKPTSEAWFDPWESYLIKKGVKLFKHTKVKQINNDKNKITSITLTNGDIIKADDYVFCTNPYSSYDIFAHSGLNKLTQTYENLTKNTSSVQISFFIGLDKEIKYPVDNIAFVMVDSEFNITWYPQDQHWINTKLGNNKAIKSLWSGTIIDANKNGKLFDKAAANLDKSKILDEVIYQIFRSKSFIKLLKDSDNNITKKNVIYKKIWKEWNYIDGKQVSDNVKWINDIYNDQYRPNNITMYPNLYIGGSHTKTTIDIWSMEGAVESGINIANHILNKYNKNDISLHKHVDPIYLKPIKFIDDILYTLNLPNIVDIVILLLVIITVRYIVNRKHKQ